MNNIIMASWPPLQKTEKRKKTIIMEIKSKEEEQELNDAGRIVEIWIDPRDKRIMAKVYEAPRLHPWKKRKSPWNINRLRREYGR